MKEESPEKLLIVSNSKENYDADKFSNHIIDQYKLYVEMADRISARRLTVHSFFLSLNSLLIAFISYVNFIGPKMVDWNFNWLVAAAGLVLCFMWNRLIRSYRDLSNAKFKVIYQIEKMLPLKLYDAEWESLGRGKNPKLYLPVTKIELSVPAIFSFIHLFVFTLSVVIIIQKLFLK